MGDYSLFDFDEDSGDSVGYPHRLRLGEWESSDSWALGPDGDALVVTLRVSHGGGGLGLALCDGRGAIAQPSLQRLLLLEANQEQGDDQCEHQLPETEPADDDVEPYVILLELCASEACWNAAFGRLQQLLAGAPQGRRVAQWRDSRESTFWLASHTAHDGRLQIEMGVDDFPNNRLFKTKFGAEHRSFTHVRLAGLNRIHSGSDDGVVLEEFKVETGIQLGEPAPAPPDNVAEEATEDINSVEKEDMDGAEGVSNGLEVAEVAVLPGGSVEEARGVSVLPGWILEAQCDEEPEVEVVPSWKLPGGDEGRPGAVLLDDNDREALIPSLDALLERIDSAERPSAFSNHYDPRSSREAVAATLAAVSAADEDATAPAAGSEPEQLALTYQPFVPWEEDEAEAQRSRAEGLRRRAQALRSDRARRRQERIAELQREHGFSESGTSAAAPPKNLGIAGGVQSQRTARVPQVPWWQETGHRD